MNHDETNNNDSILGLIIGFFVGLIKNVTTYGNTFFNHLLEITLVTIYTACLGFFVHFLLSKIFKKK